MSLARVAVAAVTVAVVCTAEVALFGQDRPGFAHDVSVAAFLVSIVAVAVLLGCAVLAVGRRARGRRVRAPE